MARSCYSYGWSTVYMYNGWCTKFFQRFLLANKHKTKEKKSINRFFLDVSIARNGIYISRDMTDDACGGGYVAFVSMDNAYKAIDIYNQQNIQHRFGGEKTHWYRNDIYT